MAGLISNGTYALAARIDNETVLWEGTPTTSCQCTEDPRNFSELKLYNSAAESKYGFIGNQNVSVNINQSCTNFEVILPHVSTANYGYAIQLWDVNSTGISLNKQRTFINLWSAATSSAPYQNQTKAPAVIKIVGINRTANG